MPRARSFLAKFSASAISAWLRQNWPVAVLVLLLVLGWLFRYQTAPFNSSGNHGVYVINRWTGQTFLLVGVRRIEIAEPTK